eukprot:Opistho-2@60606
MSWKARIALSATQSDKDEKHTRCTERTLAFESDIVGDNAGRILYVPHQNFSNFHELDMNARTRFLDQSSERPRTASRNKTRTSSGRHSSSEWESGVHSKQSKAVTYDKAEPYDQPRVAKPTSHLPHRLNASFKGDPVTSAVQTYSARDWAHRLNDLHAINSSSVLTRHEVVERAVQPSAIKEPRGRHAPPSAVTRPRPPREKTMVVWAFD